VAKIRALAHVLTRKMSGEGPREVQRFREQLARSAKMQDSNVRTGSACKEPEVRQ
jgi:hypothetical protein